MQMLELKTLRIMLNKLIEDPKVLYIYEVGLQIYGLFPSVKDRDFIIICENDYIPNFPKAQGSYGNIVGFCDSENGNLQFEIIFIKDWFERVLRGDLLAWICACLPKKFIHKEHVKLLLETNPLQLRKDFDKYYKSCIPTAENMFKAGNTITAQKVLWNIIRDVMFINQIIENHKILNFKEPQTAYKEIVNGQCTDWDTTFNVFYEYFIKHRNRLKEYTDGALKMSKLKFINQDV